MITYVEVARTSRGKWVEIEEPATIETEEFISNIIERVDRGVYRVNLKRIDDVTGEEYFEDAYCKLLEKE